MLRISLDAYIDQQPEPRPSRSEMIRKILEDRLVHEGLIRSDAEIETGIEDQRTMIADMPAIVGRSPEAGMAKMDKAIAENDLIDMKNERTIRRRGK